MKAENVYIYECSNLKCDGFMVMHERTCLQCGESNLYFDEHLEVKDQVKQEVIETLADYAQKNETVNEKATGEKKPVFEQHEERKDGGEVEGVHADDFDRSPDEIPFDVAEEEEKKL